MFFQRRPEKATQFDAGVVLTLLFFVRITPLVNGLLDGLHRPQIEPHDGVPRLQNERGQAILADPLAFLIQIGLAVPIDQKIDQGRVRRKEFEELARGQVLEFLILAKGEAFLGKLALQRLLVRSQLFQLTIPDVAFFGIGCGKGQGSELASNSAQLGDQRCELRILPFQP
jgi:hypothetical protein